LFWLTAVLPRGGGYANGFGAWGADAAASEQLVEQFRRARQDDYHRLARELERELKRPDPSLRRAGRQPRRRPALDAWRQRLTAIERIDFFASAGRDRVVTLLGQLEARGPGRRPEAVPGDQFDATRYRQRLWVTRPRPGVDRMASAWLIRRFIDPDARFGFIADQASVDGDMVPFDMFGVEFTHRGEACTFETLVALFGIHDDAAGQLAAIVHDLDLNDHRFDPAEAGTVRMLIDGLQQTYAADEELLEHGIVLFETLYRSMSSARTRTGPTPVAARRGARRRPGGTPRSR
jgi:hypothetical protein